MIARSRSRWFSGILLGVVVYATLLSAQASAQTLKEGLKQAGLSGGLVVSIGCEDATQLTDLQIGDRFVVQGLVPDRPSVAELRRDLCNMDRHGAVTAAWYDGAKLPYMDNLVNAVVLSGSASSDVNTAQLMKEIDRVLAPRGIVIVKGSGLAKLLRQSGYSEIEIGSELGLYRKPVPTEIDEWTHYLHAADNNAISQDMVVAPPRRIQWQCGPRWSRSHETDMSMSGAVSAGGRVIYFIDDGPIGVHETPEASRQLPDKASLVCRDAFNGIELWRRSVEGWGSRAWGGRREGRWTTRDQLWSAPNTLPRRLVAVDDQVFVTLGFDAVVTQLNAATGETVREFTDLGHAEEILVTEGKLIVRARSKSKSGQQPFDVLAVLDAESGNRLWNARVPTLTNLTVAAADGRLCFHDGQSVVALELASGEELWRVPLPESRKTGGHSLVIYGDAVVLATAAGPATAIALSTEDGSVLWRQNVGRSSFRGPVDVFGANGMLWMGTLSTCGIDPSTGEIAKEIDASTLFTAGHHARCYRARGTENYLMWSKRGIEFLDLEGDQHSRNDWVRGTCRYGIIPANGLIYAPPTPCFCYPGVKLNGFNAFAPAADPSANQTPLAPAARLVRGPAFSKLAQDRIDHVATADWPTYRRDNARSGATATVVPATLKQRWNVSVGNDCTPPVVAGGRLVLADKQSQTVHCLDAETGRQLWQFVAGGSVDSPPTVEGQRVVFGCADGSVYCLHAVNGELVWQFRAAPREQQIVSRGRLESSWPVHGSVLVKNGIAYFAAGRSSFLDGGILLYGVDVASGELRYQTRLDGPWNSVTEKSPHGAHWMDGARPDILVCEGDKLFMLQNVFDLKLQQLEAPVTAPHGAREMERHLIASNGFLDTTGFDRIYWMYAARWPGLYFGHAAPKTGQILVFDQETVFALHTFSQFFARSPYFAPGQEGYDLVADSIDNEPVLTPKAARSERQPGYSRGQPPRWHVKVPLWARAMTMAADTLFIAGPPDTIDPNDPLRTFEGRGGALLRAVSTTDGNTMAQYELDAQPVFDGMIAAGGKLYITMKDGSVRCWGP